MSSQPLVQPLPRDFSMQQAFIKLSRRPRLLWFDSAATGPELEPGGDHAGRFSFLCADPIERLDAALGDRNPWPILRRWSEALPQCRRPDLPPFTGGIAGLWGYEAGAWLESVGVAAANPFSTPAISVGIYDWVIAHDRVREQAWLISWGLQRRDGMFEPNAVVAEQRMQQVQQWLAEPVQPLRFEVSVESTPPAAPMVHETEVPGVWSDFSSAEYRAAVEQIVESIRAGDCFQVNLSQKLVTRATSHPADLMLRLRAENPAPYAGYYDGGDFQLISSSPEGFLRVRDRTVQTRPIKGTRKRTGDMEQDRRLATELVESEKDRAENVMIVDLMRNDLSRVCDDESVRVLKLCGIEAYAHVQHLVSVVEGRLRAGQGVIDLLGACFPGGSITGAPKIEAMRSIASREPTWRGPYCGSLGYIACGGDAEFNILIRTITVKDGWWQLPVGGGITRRSDAQEEEHETWVKAAGILRAILPQSLTTER